MNSLVRRCVPVGLVGGLSAWIAFSADSLGDYPQDAGPAVDALAHGRIADFLGLHPDMGPVSILLRAPLVALGGGGELAAYRLGAFACLLAAGLLGIYLARIAAERGAGRPAQALLAGVCLVNPLSFAALQAGHPEEILTAALAVGAVAVASRGHGGRAALLLGLALASKQWALIAVLPVLMALPAARLRAALGAAAVALALTLPGLVASPGDFLETQRSLAVDSQYVTPWSAWYPGSSATALHFAELGTTAHPHYASGFVARFSHPLIVLVALLAPLGLALRRRRFGLSGGDAMALLALLALARCLLDPVDNLYYQAPVLLAIAGWDGLDPRRLPLRALGAVALYELLSRWEPPTLGPASFNAAYLALAGLAVFAVVLMLLQVVGPQVRTNVRRKLRMRSYLELPLHQ